MPSQKRQRQRAAREQQRAALEAAERRRHTRRRVIFIVVVIALVGLVIAVTALAGDDDETDVAAEDSAFGTTPCPPEDGADERTTSFDAPFERCIEEDVDYRATIQTDVGEIEVDLAEDASPVTVNNFVALARHQFYKGVVCHRVLKDFVVQCGDPEGTGRGGPGFTIAEEPPESGEYEVGQIAMAKTAAPNSTGSQFFIIVGERGAELPPEYSLLGTITEGMDVAEAIEADGAEADPAPPEVVHTIENITIQES